jgi:hypothetical protein
MVERPFAPIFLQLSSSAFATLTGQPAYVTSFESIHRRIVSAPSSFLAPRAELRLEDLQVSLMSRAAKSGCKVYRVGDVDADLSRNAYMVSDLPVVDFSSGYH